MTDRHRDFEAEPLRLNDRGDLKLLRARLSYMREVGHDLGVDVHLGNMRYSRDGSEVKMTVVVRPAGLDIDAENFKQYAELEGLAPGMLGKTFESGGHRYEVCGLKMRGKYRVVAKRVAGGKRFKFQPSAIAAKLGTAQR
ncbi:MAG: hypothetical protein ACYSUM_24285 [Planctomycetota bacterium]